MNISTRKKPQTPDLELHELRMVAEVVYGGGWVMYYIDWFL